MKTGIVGRLAVACGLAAFLLSGCSSGTAADGNAAQSPGVSISTPSRPAYPLKVSANGRYLVDQNDVPFLVTGDSPQSLIVNLSAADAESYLANRKRAGFNTVWINLLCNEYTGGRADGSTYDGIAPFTKPGDLSTPNEAYFARADAMIRLAAAYGFTVMLDPIETGGWLTTLLANGSTTARAYGRYLGNRYRSFDNIVWINGNDFQNWSVEANDAVVRAVALGIGDSDNRHMQTVELNYKVSSSLDDASWAPIVRINAAYTYYPTYAELLDQYNRAGALPVLMVEANYEYENNTGQDPPTPLVLRRQEYWTMLSGAAGQLYGNRYSWPFLSGWQNHINTPGSAQLGYLKALFEPLRWYDLVPDQNHALVTDGYGSYASSGSISANDYATAALTADGTLGVAYLPTPRTVTVDLSRFSKGVTAQWFDPSSGSYLAIAGSPFANSGSRQFTPPATNSLGDGDWLLVMTTSATQASSSAAPAFAAARKVPLPWR